MNDDKVRCPYCGSTEILYHLGIAICYDCGEDWSVPLEDIEVTYPVKSEQDDQDK